MVGIAVLVQIARFEQTRLQREGVAIGRNRVVAGRLHVLDDQKRRVGPFLDIEVVVKLMVDNDIHPSHGHGGIGTGPQGQMVIGLLAEVGHTGIDDDPHIRLVGGLDARSARVVVVRDLGRPAPRGVNPRPVDRRHPGVRKLGNEIAREVARPLANLPSLNAVRRAPHANPPCRACHGPHARGARDARNGASAIALLNLLRLRHRRLERLVPRDAHPARIVIGLRVGALHRVAQAIGMVSSLKRGLRLRAAVPSRLERRLVALDFHRATVLHRHPYAAFHLAAASTRRAYPLDLRHGSLLARRRPERLRTL